MEIGENDEEQAFLPTEIGEKKKKLTLSTIKIKKTR